MMQLQPPWVVHIRTRVSNNRRPGMDAGGCRNFGINLEEEDFTPYLEALKDHVQAHVLNAEGTGGTALVRVGC